MIDHVGDVLAIPFFAWLSYYFHLLPDRTPEQTVLYFFSVGGLLADLVFTAIFLRGAPVVQFGFGILAYFALVYVFHLMLQY